MKWESVKKRSAGRCGFGGGVYRIPGSIAPKPDGGFCEYAVVPENTAVKSTILRSAPGTSLPPLKRACIGGRFPLERTHEAIQAAASGCAGEILASQFYGT